MSRLSFRMMSLIMSTRALFRDTQGEVTRAGVGTGDCVLDYGCGTGLSTIPAAEIVGPEGKVYALDIHPLAVETVANKARRKGLTNVQTIHSDVETGLPDGAVNRVLLFNVLPMVADPAALFRELHRVLKPDGTVAVSTGRGAKAYAGESIEGTRLERLARENGPFVRQSNTQGLNIFKKA
jgi:ubiquinone/menaquinone biosynthesis C-methylase UbiE